MRPSRSSLTLVAAIGCGPAQTVHREPTAVGCPTDTVVVLAGQDDVAAIAGCPSLAGLTIRTGMKLDLKPLGRLTEVRGDLIVGPSVGLEEVAIGELKTVGGVIRLVVNSNLHALYLPKLEHAGRIEIDGNVSMTTLALPKLAEVAESITITNDSELEVIELSELASVGKELAIADNVKLVMVQADKLTRVGAIRIENNKVLPTEQVDALRAHAPK